MTVEIGGILRGIDCQRRNKYHEISRYCVDLDESLPSPPLFLLLQDFPLRGDLCLQMLRNISLVGRLPVRCHHLTAKKLDTKGIDQIQNRSRALRGGQSTRNNSAGHVEGTIAEPSDQEIR